MGISSNAAFVVVPMASVDYLWMLLWLCDLLDTTEHNHELQNSCEHL